jgi:hypothetical protein
MSGSYGLLWLASPTKGSAGASLQAAAEGVVEVPAGPAVVDGAAWRGDGLEVKVMAEEAIRAILAYRRDHGLPTLVMRNPCC